MNFNLKWKNEDIVTLQKDYGDYEFYQKDLANLSDTIQWFYPQESKLTGLEYKYIYVYECVIYISYRIQKMSVQILIYICIYMEIKHWSNTKRDMVF